MSRRRYLSTDISIDSRVNRLAIEHGDFAALLYTWLIPHAADDATISSDPEKLLMMVIPGRRDKSTADVESAIAGMVSLDLLERVDDRTLRFPPDAFYRYQTYVQPAKRADARPPHGEPPTNADKRRKSPEIADEQRETPEKAASVSPSFSPSPSPSTPFIPLPSAPADNGEGDETGAGAPAKTELAKPVKDSDDAGPAVNGTAYPAAHPPARSRTAPKPDRLAEIVGLCQTESIPLEVGQTDKTAVKNARASPRLIFEAYRAAYQGEWDPGGNGWLQGNLSLATVLKRIAGYQAWVDNGRTAKRPDATDRRRSAGAGRGLPSEADRDRQDRELEAAFAGEPDDAG